MRKVRYDPGGVMKIAVFLVGFSVILTGCNSQPPNEPETLETYDLSKGKPATQCENGTQAVDRMVAVSKETVLRTEPANSSDKIVNEKLSSALKETQYQNVDQTEKLREVCQGDGWSKVRVVEPDWLTNVEGWLKTSSLRGLSAAADGKRTYVVTDFYWDKDIVEDKQKIVNVVNRITREKSDCPVIDPGSVSLSGNRGSPDRPVYYVMCQNEPVHNVWFTASGEILPN